MFAAAIIADSRARDVPTGKDRTGTGQLRLTAPPREFENVALRRIMTNLKRVRAQGRYPPTM